MKHSRRKRAALLTLLLLVSLVAIPIGLTWWQVRQEQLSHALIAAVEQRNTSLVRRLLHQGANPNATVQPDDNRSIWQRLRDIVRHESPYEEGDPALMAAVESDDIVQPLDNVDDNVDIVQALVDAGANVNARNRFSQTPLEMACHMPKTIEFSWHIMLMSTLRIAKA